MTSRDRRSAENQTQATEPASTERSGTSPDGETTVGPTDKDKKLTPDYALARGHAWLDNILNALEKMDLENPTQKQGWVNECNTLKDETLPKTTIAVAGPTGAGKSALLNALLGDNIVPTSGNRACTSVIIEIAWHQKVGIDFEAQFITEEEWRKELDVLLNYLNDVISLRKPDDEITLDADSQLGWHKIRAVYPELTLETLSGKTVDELMAEHPGVNEHFGTLKEFNNIRGAKQLAKKMNPYVVSRNNETSLEHDPSDTPEIWPLVKFVKIWCGADVLKSGAVLVDLPGLEDSNVARGAVAKHYIKTCDRIWIVAPIQRAVDNQIAKNLLGESFQTQMLMDGRYHKNSITFITTKTDDVLPSEVVPSHNLDRNPDWKTLDKRITQCQRRCDECQKLVTKAQKTIEATNKATSQAKFQLRALGGDTSGPLSSPIGKRKAGKQLKPKTTKRRKASNEGVLRSLNPDEESDELEDDEEEEEESSEEDDTTESDREDVRNPFENFTEEQLKEQITDSQEKHREASAKLKEAQGELSQAKQELATVKVEAKAFCAKKRSENTVRLLKRDFKDGLRNLEQASEEQLNPDTFDPQAFFQNRDYSHIDLQVFPVSSRDFMSLSTKKGRRDADPACFSTVEDTGIPELREWCHTLTVDSREKAIQAILHRFIAMLQAIRTYNASMIDASLQDQDRLAFRDLWQSEKEVTEEETPSMASVASETTAGDDSDTTRVGNGSVDRASSIAKSPATAVATNKVPNGVSLRLKAVFQSIEDAFVQQFQHKLDNFFQRVVIKGVAKAQSMALKTSDDFANRKDVPWQTYRAVLRSLGEYRSHNLNEKLASPISRSIAHQWNTFFKNDFLLDSKHSITKHVRKLLVEVESTTPGSLKDRCHATVKNCLDLALLTVAGIARNLPRLIEHAQQNASDLAVPHVQSRLIPGYTEATIQTGSGMSKRQRAIFRSYVELEKTTMFEEATQLMRARLQKAVLTVREEMHKSLFELADKTETNLSPLWHVPNTQSRHLRYRNQLSKLVEETMTEAEDWLKASERRYPTTPAPAKPKSEVAPPMTVNAIQVAVSKS